MRKPEGWPECPVEDAARWADLPMAMTMTGEVQLPATQDTCLGQAERSGGAQGLHSRMPVAGPAGRERLPGGRPKQDRPGQAPFKGKVTLTDLDPPNGYKISGEGEGGVAGFAKGGAVVNLADEGGGTLLIYDVEAQIGGKLAQLGQRLINGVAKKMADQFFQKFRRRRQRAARPPPEQAYGLAA